MKRIKILGIPVDPLNRAEVLEKLTGFIAIGQPHQVATVNAEFIVEAQKNREFRDILTKSDLSLVDGSGVVFAAQYLGYGDIPRVPGADLAQDLIGLAAERQWPVYVIGGGEGVAQKAVSQLKEWAPDVVIAGAEPGLSYREGQSADQFDEGEVAALVERITKASPKILLVGFGAPRQELFIARYAKQLKVPVMIGVGGTLDFWSGRVERAPEWMRGLSLEWLWRVYREPKRLKRIVRAVVVFPLLVLFRGHRRS